VLLLSTIGHLLAQEWLRTGGDHHRYSMVFVLVPWFHLRSLPHHAKPKSNARKEPTGQRSISHSAIVWSTALRVVKSLCYCRQPEVLPFTG